MENNEVLFWKVFRNKFLQKCILYRLFTGKHALKYHEIFNVQLMVEDNEIQLLKDKVKTSQYLVGFDETLQSLFSLIKDDQDFYSDLFNNYPHLLSPTHLELKINYILILDCIGALKSFVEEHNYNPTPMLVIKSLKLLSYKSFKYMIYHLNGINSNQHQHQHQDHQHQDQQKQRQQNSKRIIPFKVEEFWETKFKFPHCFYKFTNFMVSNFNIKPCSITSTIKRQYYGVCPLESSMLVKDLKNACISIIQLGVTNSNKIENLIYLQLFTNVNEIKESVNILTKFERNQTLFDFIHNLYNQRQKLHEQQQQEHQEQQKQQEHQKQQKQQKQQEQQEHQPQKDCEKMKLIFKLLNMYYQYSSLEGISGFYGLLLLDIKSNDEDLNKKNKILKAINLNEKTDLIFSLRFGNFDLFKKCYSTFEKYRDEINLRWRFLILFQFLKNRIKQITFINQVCQFLISKNEMHLDFGFNQFFFNQILLFDDLQLIELIYNKFNKPRFNIEVNYQQYEPWSIFYFIRSIKVLDFIFNDCLKDKTKTLPIMDFIINNRLDLIKRYKSLLPINSIPFKFESALPQYYLESNLIKSLLNGIISFIESPISDECGFNSSSNQGIVFYEKYFNNITNIDGSFSKFTSHFGSNLKEIVIPMSQRSLFSKGHFRILFSRWLFYNNPRYYLSDQAINGTGIFRSDIDLFKQVFNTTQPNDFIDNFMNVYFPKDKNNKITINSVSAKEVSSFFIGWFRRVLINQSKNGDIILFKSLIENDYYQTFSPTGVFGIQISNILFCALNNGHLALSKYLIEKLKISIDPYEFNLNVKDKSITYHSLFN
ncbi:hypothetical protein ACTA71_000257 [Dictyostelium dimigraforme]